MVKNNIKEMQDERFSWVNCATDRRYSVNDVSINLIKGKGKNKTCISFTFRNDVWEIIGNKIEFAIYKNRVVFRDSSEGLEIKGNKKTKNRYARVSSSFAKEIEILKEFIGDYELKYDSFYELYYIEKQEKKA